MPNHLTNVSAPSVSSTKPQTLSPPYAVPPGDLIRCPVCRHEFNYDPTDVGVTRGNSSTYRNHSFTLWKCSRCQTIRALDKINFEEIYACYPLKKRKLDAFAKGSFAKLLKRLKQVGLNSTQRILDYGCGNGLLVQYLRESGYPHVDGFDPYDDAFKIPPGKAAYDFVICNDVIEHCDEPHELLRSCAETLTPEGTLYLGTSDSEGVEMDNLLPHLMRLHLPYHRVLFTEESLHFIAREGGFEVLNSWRRSYMDTWRPFCNYRFLDAFNAALDHEMDKAFEPGAAWAMLRAPALWFHAFFGKLYPNACEPAVILRKVKNGPGNLPIQRG